MKLNLESIKDDIRKIGVALIVAGLVSGLIKENAFFEVIYPVFFGIVLIALGVLENKDE